MDKGEFLRWAAEHTPWTRRPIPRIPDEWWDEVEQVWAGHLDFLDNVLRSISKMGGHIWVSEAALREYGRALTVEEQVGLFRAIRGRYPWLEPAFRPEFERGFPESVGALPPPFTEAEVEQHWAAVKRTSVPGWDIPY
jgi:hypothetical protein